jgi:hypothetical protein
MNKSYLCKVCLENKPENFIQGRYSTCRKCLNAYKIKSKAERDKDKKYDSLPDYKDVFLAVEKYISTSYGLIEDFTIKGAIKDLQEKILIREKEHEKLTNEILEIKKINSIIREEVVYELNQEINLLKQENEKLRKMVQNVPKL